MRQLSSVSCKRRCRPAGTSFRLRLCAGQIILADVSTIAHSPDDQAKVFNRLNGNFHDYMPTIEGNLAYSGRIPIKNTYVRRLYKPRMA
jgi:hypothetical protein